MSAGRTDRVRQSPCVRRSAPLARLAVALLIGASISSTHAQDGVAVFRIDDVPDEVHLSDSAVAAPGVAVTRVLDVVRAPPRFFDPRTVARQGTRAEQRYAALIDAAAVAQRIDPQLLHALIAVESAYRPHAVSTKGAAGLTQLMPATAKAYGVTDVFDARQNIDAGARHLRWLLDRYRENVSRALAAYNAGSGAVEKNSGPAGPWPSLETAVYVERVLGRYAALRLRVGLAATR